MKVGEFSWEGSKRVQFSNGVGWYLTKQLRHMECYIDQEGDELGKRVAMSEQTWTTLTFANGRAEVETMVKNGVGGMTFLVTDAGPFARSVAAEAKSKGLDVPIQKDILVQIEELAQGLIAQAAGINGATAVQMEIFSVRYAELNSMYAMLEERMDKIKSLIDLAGLAVAEAV